MEYIAHTDGKRQQLLQEHLQGTAQLAATFAASFGKEEYGYCCGMLHDIGKYSDEFQHKIKENTNDKVDHSTAGAKICNEQRGWYFFLAYCVAGHHAGLPDYGDKEIFSSLCGRIAKTVYDYQAYKKEIEIPKLHTNLVEMRKDKNINFSLSVAIRMLYSCLVDADFLDTENFMKNGKVERDCGDSMEVLLDKLETYISHWLHNTDLDTINGRRTEILKHCLKNGKEQKRGLFRLTVPTGGGKTIASLAFALNHAVQNKMDRIIYVIPYTSIIEQNAEVFRKILGEHNVLENHCNVNYNDTEEFKPMKLASENWDKPVIVTTNVQFFESLFANKSSKCRKIHNIANSVIVLDEAQMLPLDYLLPCTAMLQELTDAYRASVVLCSATQPALDSFFGKQSKIFELCPRVEEQFRFFKRVACEKLGNISKEILIEYLNKETTALCILNTKKLVQEFYKELEDDGVYHLSTSMYPKHRRKVLDEIRNRLDEIRKHPEDGKRCVVLSTSLVEAGVDLDFITVYRQISGIDSIIQAGGRCNREGKNEPSKSKLYIFDLEDMKNPNSQKQQIDITRGILQDYEDITELDSITDYFKQLYHCRGTSLDKKNILGEFDKLKFNFSKVGKEFKLIENQTKTIFINKEPEAKEILQEIRQIGISKERMRMAQQYCVQIQCNAADKNNLFEKLYQTGMVKPVLNELPEFYELISQEQYSEAYGLDLFFEDGIALFS